MLGLVSPLANASLETWEANLDLTIPSLEMPSTLVLDSKDKHEIMMGWTCCWAKQHIDSVHLEHSLKSTGLQSKGNPNQLQFTLSELPNTFDWTAFYTLQLLDIYTTYRGLKYDCVQELNPLVGESPSVPKMFAVKTAILLPAIEMDRRTHELTSDTFDYMNILMGVVIVNNIQQVSDAKKYCNKK